MDDWSRLDPRLVRLIGFHSPTGRDATALASTSRAVRLAVGPDRDRRRTAARWRRSYRAVTRSIMLAEMRRALGLYLPTAAGRRLVGWGFDPVSHMQDLRQLQWKGVEVVRDLLIMEAELPPDTPLKTTRIIAAIYNHYRDPGDHLDDEEAHAEVYDMVESEAQPIGGPVPDQRIYNLIYRWLVISTGDLAVAWCGVLART